MGHLKVVIDQLAAKIFLPSLLREVLFWLVCQPVVAEEVPQQQLRLLLLKKHLRKRPRNPSQNQIQRTAIWEWDSLIKINLDRRISGPLQYFLIVFFINFLR